MIFSYDARARARSTDTESVHIPPKRSGRSKISGALLGSLAARSCDVTSQSVFRQSNDRVAKGISIVDRRMIPLNKTLPRDLCPKESSGRLGR